jgi:hypothetical protein
MPRTSKKSNVVKMRRTCEPRPASEMTSDEIARRAYEMYMSRGGAQGHDIDDWLQAERELREASVRVTA